MIKEQKWVEALEDKKYATALELAAIPVLPEVTPGIGSEPSPEEELERSYRRWIEALRSGDYAQGKNALCATQGLHGEVDRQRFYCCLGVVNEVVFGAAWWTLNDFSSLYDDLDQHFSLDATRRDALGLNLPSTPDDRAEALNALDASSSFRKTLNYPMADDREHLLMGLNDAGVSFEGIARFLEQREWWKEACVD